MKKLLLASLLLSLAIVPFTSANAFCIKNKTDGKTIQWFGKSSAWYFEQGSILSPGQKYCDHGDALKHAKIHLQVDIKPLHGSNTKVCDLTIKGKDTVKVKSISVIGNDYAVHCES